MKYTTFEHIISRKRLEKYLVAAGGDTRKAMTLYRLNLHLSQEMFTIVSCFEVALRNAIDANMTATKGENWLRDSVLRRGMFSNNQFKKTKTTILYTYKKLTADNRYSASKLLAEMEFGVWKYMFSPAQFTASGQTLLKIFPNKLRSTKEQQYNHSYIFNELDKINTLRNRIAHHEPICFVRGDEHANTSYIINEYQKIMTLFAWMGIDSTALLYGLDHVQKVCNEINTL